MTDQKDRRLRALAFPGSLIEAATSFSMSPCPSYFAVLAEQVDAYRKAQGQNETACAGATIEALAFGGGLMGAMLGPLIGKAILREVARDVKRPKRKAPR